MSEMSMEEYEALSKNEQTLLAYDELVNMSEAEVRYVLAETLVQLGHLAKLTLELTERFTQISGQV